MYELHDAARNGDLGAIAAQIGANANLNEPDQHSRTPLLIACWSGQTVSTESAGPIHAPCTQMNESWF